MSNRYVDNELRQMLDSAMERERERLKKASHRRNVAAMVDFASNLISLVGRSKGVRAMPVTNIQSQYHKSYGAALERYNKAMRDYKGIIAGDLFRQRLAANKKIRPQQPQPSPGKIDTSAFSLRKKNFDFEMNNNSKKYIKR